MSDIKIDVVEVDSIVLALLKKHSEDVSVDGKNFLNLLKHSLSLNTQEKKRVIDTVPTLSQFQFDELSKVFTEEREKFKSLAKEHPEDIKKLLLKQQSEWIQLGDLYKSEAINNIKENEDKVKEEEIKKSLGL
jgi:hypothetical protein